MRLTMRGEKSTSSIKISRDVTLEISKDDLEVDLISKLGEKVDEFAQALMGGSGVEISKCFVVGQYRGQYSKGVAWDLQGIYLDEKRAIEACIKPSYCYFPILFNQELPDHQIIAKAIYPKFVL